MQAKKDIENRQQLYNLLHAFYAKAMNDALIGKFFTTVVPLHLERHLPVITSFWEAVLFGTPGYRKDVMQVHRNIHRLCEIQPAHLNRWVQLFTQTVDEMFLGTTAELAKQRAVGIARLMNLKLNNEGFGNAAV